MLRNEGIQLNRKMLESERLLLRPLSFDELSYIYESKIDRLDIFIEEEAIFDFVKIAISKKLEKMKKVNAESHDWFTYWLIIDKDSHRGIGFIGFKGIPDGEGYTEVGYSISTNYRKQGLMTEALSALSKWTYGFENCNGITASRVLKTNTGSNMVLSNCKFKLVNSNEEENYYVLKFDRKAL